MSGDQLDLDAFGRDRLEQWAAGIIDLTGEEAVALVAEVRRLRAFERRFRDLFAGGPDTSCRTTYPDGVECVEVPMDDLREAFAEEKP